MAQPKKLKVLVSSTVYGIEELLERVYSILTSFGYEVWMSHKGTMPVYSDRSAYENCLAGVQECDLFLGIITPQYGSGIEPTDDDSPSITHMEIQKALELNKPRWLLAHRDVVFARSFLQSLGYKNGKERATLKTSYKKSRVFGDLRVIDIYDEAIVDEKDLMVKDRKGNWVQKFETDADAQLFVSAQFSRYQEVEKFIEENFKNLPSPDEEASR